MFRGFQVEKYFKQPLVWCWLFVVVWAFYVGFTLVSALWDGLVISLAGLFAALLVVSAIMSRRRKNFYRG